MKSILKAISIFFLSIFVINGFAQSPNPNTKGWPLSKGVQFYSNKDLKRFKPIKIKMRGTPSFVQTKRQASNEKPISENVPLTGSPDWIISKPVNLINK
jgi:hypothetical protein